MKQQIVWFHKQCVWHVRELRRKISSQRVLLIKHIWLTLANAYHLYIHHLTYHSHITQKQSSILVRESS